MKLLNDDCLEALKALPESSVHAVVTDPPYGLSAMRPKEVSECLSAWSAGETWTPKGSGFMGKAWDAWVPPPELWREVARVLKPGGHLLVFAGSRTQDLMSVSLRLAGLEIRDTLQWLYGSGFPKSHDVSKALDKLAGAEREEVGVNTVAAKRTPAVNTSTYGDYKGQSGIITAPATEQAKQWDGWGTALKPAYEPVILARKPLEGTVAQNTLDHGCGGINVDGCRVDMNGESVMSTDNGVAVRTSFGSSGLSEARVFHSHERGRFPTNVLIDDTTAQLLDDQVGANVSRFFYTAKTSRKEREAGLGSFALRDRAYITGRKEGSRGLVGEDGSGNPYAGVRSAQPRANVHPTVKPIELMRYLVRLVTPPQGTVLDPFMGSGSTGCAAALEGVDFIGIEREVEYFEIASARIEHWSAVASCEAERAVEDEHPTLF